jgi:hypothetical protein
MIDLRSPQRWLCSAVILWDIMPCSPAVTPTGLHGFVPEGTAMGGGHSERLAMGWRIILKL